jgi:hypothetical protein
MRSSAANMTGVLAPLRIRSRAAPMHGVARPAPVMLAGITTMGSGTKRAGQTHGAG